MFPLIRVDARSSVSVEPLGKKRKFWYRDANRQLLFKMEERGTGEDWAEKIACELADMLGLPHVHYELAIETASGIPGVVCENCAAESETLVLGNELLLVSDANYPADRQYKVRAHTVEAVRDVLALLDLPPAPWNNKQPKGISSALELFAGYLMLDAWIANQDRHHQNWGAILTPKQVYLAPSFDHGAALARNISDRERLERLETRDANRKISAFTRKARSALYVDTSAKQPLTTIGAWTAFSRMVPEAAILWMKRLHAISPESIDTLLEQIPPDRMSHVCRRFTGALLLENRTRLLAGEQE